MWFIARWGSGYVYCIPQGAPSLQVAQSLQVRRQVTERLQMSHKGPPTYLVAQSVVPPTYLVAQSPVQVAKPNDRGSRAQAVGELRSRRWPTERGLVACMGYNKCSQLRAASHLPPSCRTEFAAYVW